jgi:integrase
MARGHIEQLPSGSHRAMMYFGVDPLTRKQRYRRGKATNDYQKAVADLAELLDVVEQEQQADTRATVGFLLARYLELVELSPTTRPGYERGTSAGPSSRLWARCRSVACEPPPWSSCTPDCGCARSCAMALAGRRVTQVRQWRDREKEVRAVHECRPLATSTVHQLNSILSGAFEMAIRWEWLSRNPARQAKLPRLVRHEPEPLEPPEPEEIGRMLDHAWSVNPALAVYIWLAVVSGARRGELCGWRWIWMVNTRP